MTERKFLYRANIIHLLFIIAVFSFGIWIFYKEASLTVNDLTIFSFIQDRNIELSVLYTKVLYWSGFLFCIFMVIFGLSTAASSILGKDNYLVINENKLTIPKAPFSRKVTLVYNELESISYEKVSGSYVLLIKTGKENYSLNRYCFKNESEFEDAVQTILSNMRRAKD